MEALYVHCPFCAFPHVISGLDVAKSRYCRQCRGVFSPIEKIPRPLRPAQAKGKQKRRGRRIALRSILNKR